MSLLARIFLLVGFILAVVMAVQIHDLFSLQDKREAEIRAEALRLAYVAGSEQDRIIEGARQLLIGLSQFRSVKQFDTPACSQALAAVKQRVGIYDYLGAVDLGNRVFCSSNAAQPFTLQGRALSELVPADRLFIGTYDRAHVSDKPILRMTYPFEDENGKLAGYLMAGLSLDWLRATLADRHLPDHTVLLITDHNGIILARQPDRGTVGTSVRDPLLAVLHAPSPGTLMADTGDGTQRVFGYTPVELPPGRGMFVAVGIDSAAALSEFRTALWRDLGWVGLALLVAGVGAFLYIERFICKPLGDLLATAHRWREGDWSARAARNPHVAEVDRLAVAFNAAGDAVAAREQRLQASTEELRRSEANLARAQRVSNTGYDRRDLRSDEALWSDEAYRIFGVTRGDFVPSTANFLRLVHPEDRAIIARSRCHIACGMSPLPFEYRIIRPDGAERVIYREVEVSWDEAGRPLHMLGTLKDVTELRAAEERQRQLERQLQHSQKLEALGTLAGGIAHDLNNTLVPILALAKISLRQLARGGRDYANLETILHASERARDLVRQILAFSRKQELVKQEVDLAALTRETLHMLRAGLPATVDIDEQIERVPPILGDPGQLQQVVVNLMTNAAQAIGGRIGTISVTLAAAAAPREGVAETSVRLTIADTGCGMDRATLDRIFEPFFTTKPVGEGTGLGLSVAHGIVTSHGGRIAVESEPGSGTTITILLPALNEAAAAAPLEAVA